MVITQVLDTVLARNSDCDILLQSARIHGNWFGNYFLVQLLIMSIFQSLELDRWTLMMVISCMNSFSSYCHLASQYYCLYPQWNLNQELFEYLHSGFEQGGTSLLYKPEENEKGKPEFGWIYCDFLFSFVFMHFSYLLWRFCFFLHYWLCFGDFLFFFIIGFTPEH